MSTEQYAPIASIHPRADARPLEAATVASIKESIGLSQGGEPLHPPVVRVLGDGFELIDGHHRLRAMEDLGNAEIKVSVVDLDDLHAELMMIDGNLCRAELTGIQRDQQTARRKAIYEKLHPETRYGSSLKVGSELPCRQVGDTERPVENVERFTAATAAVTGRSERSIQRSAERGEKIAPAAANLMQGTRLDTGSYASRIKDLPAAEQVAKVQADLAEPPRPAPAPKPAPAGPSDFERFIELADEIEALRIGTLIASAGRQRSTLGQRASGLATFASDIMEGMNR